MRFPTMIRFRTAALPLALLILSLAACGGNPEPTEASEAHDEADESAASGVAMTQAELQATGIKLLTLQPSAATERLRAPGEVLDSAYNTTLVTPRVEALVVRRYAKLGDEVQTGEPLVALASVEVSDAQAELRIAEQEYQRVASLGPEAVAGRRITEARVALDRARARARAYGLPGTASGRANGQFTLTAPHDGRITEDEFVVGQRIEPGTPLFRLVDESIVWVDARVPPDAAQRVEAGTPAAIVFNGRSLPGTVLRTAHRTSDTTRNAAVRIEVPNKGDQLHAGDFVEVFFNAGSTLQATNPKATELTVPVDAIVQLEGDTVVFRRETKGTLAPVPVRTGETIGERILVTEGLKPGDVIVVEGAFNLKARMLKSQMGEGHGH